MNTSGLATYRFEKPSWQRQMFSTSMPPDWKLYSPLIKTQNNFSLPTLTTSRTYTVLSIYHHIIHYTLETSWHDSGVPTTTPRSPVSCP